MDEHGRAWAALLRVHAAVVPLLDRELQAAHGLPLTWYDVLLELNSAPDRRLQMGELGAKAVVSRSRVSRVVDELDQGRAGRAGAPTPTTGGRARRITAAGRARLRAAAPTYLAGIEQHFGTHLDDDEARAIATALFRVVEDQPTPAGRRRS